MKQKENFNNVLLDSWVWISILKDKTKFQEIEKYLESKLVLSSICLYEIYRKVLLHYPEGAEIRIGEVITLNKIIPVSIEIALRAAELRKKYEFSTADAIILATAESEKALLVTGDKHFKNVKEVKVILLK